MKIIAGRFACLFVILVLVSCSASKSGTGKKAKADAAIWQATPISIDGDDTDWMAPFPNYDSKAGIAYAVTNDSSNLYISVKTGDDKIQNKILHAGMTVYIDITGTKDQKTAINFPVAGTEPYIPEHHERSSEGQDQSRIQAQGRMRQRAVAEAVDMNLDGFATGNGAYNIRQHIPNGIMVRLGFNSYRELVYEAKIPFADFYKQQLTASDAGKPVSVGIFVHAPKQPAMPKDGSGGMPGNASMGGGGGRIGNGGMGGRGGGGMRNTGSTTESIYEPTKTWKQAGLAWK